MRRVLLDTRVFTDPSWWHWTLTVPLLLAHLLGAPWAIEGALVLCAVMTLYYLFRLRRLHPFPVQLRLAFFAWLLVGVLPGMQWMHYIALAGTTMRVTVGYCLLARLLSLAWFNRTEPLTIPFLRRQFFSPPSGALLRWRPAPESVASIPVHGNPGNRQELRSR
jgi:hypothetical protein